MNTFFNFKLVDGSQVSQSFSLVPINFPTVSSSFVVNGDILTGSVSPVTIDLLGNVYKVELNKGAANNWYFSGSNSTASAAIVSGSYSTGSLCSVTFNNLNNGRNYDAGKTISIRPVAKNVGFNDSFILQDTVYYTTDATGSLIVSLVPQIYSVEYHGTYRTEQYNISVPNSASVNVKDILVTSNNVAKIITPKNASLYSYTAEVIDQKIGAITYSGSLSSSFASASISSSYSRNSDTASFVKTAQTASYYGGSVVSASHALNSDTAITSAFATNSTNAVNAQTASLANAISFVPLNATSASWAPVQISSSFAQNSFSASHANKSDTAITSAFAQSVSGSVTGVGPLLNNGLITSHNTTASNGAGVVVYADNALAIALSVGGANSNITYDNNGGFSIQPTTRGTVIGGTSPGTSVFSITQGSSNVVINNKLSVNGATQVNGLDVNGNISCSVITASLLGNASTATSSSFANVAGVANSINFVPSVAVSASFASQSLSASFVTASNVRGMVTSASYAKNSDTASVANSISFVPTTASFATTAGVANSINFVPAFANSSSVTVSSSFASQSISSSYSLYAKTSFVDDINYGLVAYLPFDEGSGSAIRNYSSVNVDATKLENFNGLVPYPTGSGWNTNSKRGGFSQLLTGGNSNGTASWVEFNSSIIGAGLAQMSFGIWYQSSGSNVGAFGVGRLVTKFVAGTTGEYSYAITNNSIGVILVNSLNQRLDQNVNTPVLNDNKWHYIAGTYDGATSSVYVDGKLCGATAFTGSLQNSPYKLRVGTFENLGLAPTIGYVDEFKLWGRALTSNEILYLYNDGNFENNVYVDANNIGTISGSLKSLGGFTGSLLGTASFATTAGTANAISFTPATASFAVTASFAISASKALSSSFATTASYGTDNTRLLRTGDAMSGSLIISSSLTKVPLTITASLSSSLIMDCIGTGKFTVDKTGNVKFGIRDSAVNDFNYFDSTSPGTIFMEAGSGLSSNSETIVTIYSQEGTASTNLKNIGTTGMSVNLDDFEGELTFNSSGDGHSTLYLYDLYTGAGITFVPGITGFGEGNAANQNNSPVIKVDGIYDNNSLTPNRYGRSLTIKAEDNQQSGSGGNVILIAGAGDTGHTSGSIVITGSVVCNSSITASIFNGTASFATNSATASYMSAVSSSSSPSNTTTPHGWIKMTVNGVVSYLPFYQ